MNKWSVEELDEGDLKELEQASELPSCQDGEEAGIGGPEGEAEFEAAEKG